MHWCRSHKFLPKFVIGKYTCKIVFDKKNKIVFDKIIVVKIQTGSKARHQSK